jgi:sigma-B regulation protein RsbU (phosphoserine phosphatase)
MPQIDLSGAKILLVDDTPANLKVLRQALEPEGYSILVATNGEAALKVAQTAGPDLILLDVQMPGIDGYETCRRLKQNEATQDIPVIFVTAQAETEAIVTGFQVGGVDYIPKPFQSEEVLVRVHTHLKIDRLAREVEAAQQRLIDEMEQQLQTAHDLQMGLMPKESPQIEGLDIAGRCIPAGQVGGDVFQYAQRDDSLAVCLADVTGKAMEAAIPMVLFDGILESHMEQGNELEDLFSRLNRLLCRKLRGHTSVCFVMGELDLKHRAFRVVNGGCPYPYLFRAETGEVLELQTEAYPLGIAPGTDYLAVEERLHPGDCVIFCSDGIIEADDGTGRQFGFERTSNTVRTAGLKGLSSEATIEFLLEAVQGFRGSAQQSDDMTCVVLRVEPGPTRTIARR